MGGQLRLNCWNNDSVKPRAKLADNQGLDELIAKLVPPKQRIRLSGHV
jgi:hypothetical protein